MVKFYEFSDNLTLFDIQEIGRILFGHLILTLIEPYSRNLGQDNVFRIFNFSREKASR